MEGSYESVIRVNLCNISLDVNDGLLTFVRNIYRQRGTNNIGREEN